MVGSLRGKDTGDLEALLPEAGRAGLRDLRDRKAAAVVGGAGGEGEAGPSGAPREQEGMHKTFSARDEAAEVGSGAEMGDGEDKNEQKKSKKDKKDKKKKDKKEKEKKKKKKEKEKKGKKDVRRVSDKELMEEMVRREGLKREREEGTPVAVPKKKRRREG